MNERTLWKGVGFLLLLFIVTSISIYAVGIRRAILIIALHVLFALCAYRRIKKSDIKDHQHDPVDSGVDSGSLRVKGNSQWNRTDSNKSQK